MTKVAIVIPTFNQPKHLALLLESITRFTKSSYHIYIVDNSTQHYAKMMVKGQLPITILEQKENLGWMKSINLGIRETKEPYVLMLNDDTQMLDFDGLWLQKMLNTFTILPDIGAVAPMSNAVLPGQMLGSYSVSSVHILPLLSGLCLLVKRSVIDKVGLLDESLPGGDDLDYSLRIRQAGYFLANRRDVFIYHYGSLTGQSLMGSYYNSSEQQEAFRTAIIKKHGFKEYIRLQKADDPQDASRDMEWEHHECLNFIVGKGIDVGCGANKVSPDAIGVDITPKGEEGRAGSQLGVKSQADVTYDGITLPFETESMDYVCARHCLEHCVDDMYSLKEWTRVLKPGGTLIIAVPDEEVVDGMALDPSHKHTYTVESLKSKLGYVMNYSVDTVVRKFISFILVVRKGEAK